MNLKELNIYILCISVSVKWMENGQKGNSLKCKRKKKERKNEIALSICQMIFRRDFFFFYLANVEKIYSLHLLT